MSRKLKNSKNMANQKKDKDTISLANLVIEELENEKFDLNILQKIQQAFSTKPKDREAFINFLDEKLNNKQLHKLNRAVVENANELMPSNDPNFVCRTPNNKIFQQLLLLEASSCGMKAKFNAKSELQPLNVTDVPQEILSHYSILKQTFYPQIESKDLTDSRIAQSINFLLYAPLFRESEIYQKLGLAAAAKIEHEMQDSNGKFVKNLVEEKIATPVKEDLENKKNEAKEDKISSIIKKSIKELEKNKKVVVKSKQQEKIKRHISKFLEEVSDETLTSKKNDLIDIIYQGLHKNQSKWSKLANYFGVKSYSISRESFKKIKKVINKIKNFHAPMNPEIQKQLKQIVTELNKINTPDNPTLPSEVKKANSKTKAKPPILKKRPVNHK